MTKQQELLLRKEFNEKLRMQFQRGLQDGSKAISGVIYEKVKKYNGNNADDIIDDIKKFCEVGLGLNKK